MRPYFREAVRSRAALPPARRLVRQETRALLPTEGAPSPHQGSALAVPRERFLPLKTPLARQPHHAAPFAHIRCKNTCSTHVVGKQRSHRRGCFPLLAMLPDTSVPKGTRRFASR